MCYTHLADGNRYGCFKTWRRLAKMNTQGTNEMSMGKTNRNSRTIAHSDNALGGMNTLARISATGMTLTYNSATTSRQSVRNRKRNFTGETQWFAHIRKHLTTKPQTSNIYMLWVVGRRPVLATAAVSGVIKCVTGEWWIRQPMEINLSSSSQPGRAPPAIRYSAPLQTLSLMS